MYVPPLEADAAIGSVSSGLRRVSRRLRTESLLIAVAIATGFAALTWLTTNWTVRSGVVRLGLALAVGITLFAWRVVARRQAWSSASAARAIERAVPASRNVVVTAEELLRHPERARPSIRQRVLEDASRVSDGVNAAAVIPLRRSSLLAAAAVATSIVVYAVPVRSTMTVAGARSDVRATEVRPSGMTVMATIASPMYAGGRAQTFENPERLEALAGSRLDLVVRGAGRWRVRFGSRTLDQRSSTDGAAVQLVLAESGYLAVEPAEGNQGDDRRLIPLVVNPDRAPTIRVEAPGKDLLLPDAKRVVAVRAAATDDHGLAALDLRYTKISGSGEQFEFKEGVVPLRISRANDRSWTADAELAIAQLGIAPGDSLVYRIVGRDHRPGDAGVSSSDTFFVEVAGPGQIALEGFELPPDRERYALSQQMIVLKLERLRARERTIDRATLEQEIGNLAAEQRAVRANFIFLTGGTVEDEEEEAEHSHEIQEGRLEHSARREIGRAIQHMTRAEQAMGAVNTAEALPPARAAVEALQRAFGRNRYFLRTVPVRSRVDPSRRLTGNLSEASSWRRELFAAPEAGSATRARVLLARLVELSPQIQRREVPAAALTAFAEEAISIDAASADWQGISRTLTRLRDARDESAAGRKALVDQAAGAIASMLRKTSAPATRRETATDRLRSAWRDAMERK
jgi:hypothetical protein